MEVIKSPKNFNQIEDLQKLGIPTPGWGPRHPPGAPPRDGGWGRGIKHSKPRGTGDFSVKSPGVFGGFLL